MRHIKTIYLYCKERFPPIIVAITSFLVVLSSLSVLNYSRINLIFNIIIATITLLCFMFYMRVIDDYKDKEFDNKYHKDRQIQKGKISLKYLIFLSIILTILILGINFIKSVYASLFLFMFLIYNFASIYNFGLKKLRDNMLLYNILNMMQMIFLQFYIYSIFSTQINFINPLLYMHFFFVLGNISLLEVARKLRGKKEETRANDTYSSYLGIRKSGLIFMFISIITFSLYIILILGINKLSLTIFPMLSLISIFIFVENYTLGAYKRVKKYPLLLALIFYITTHLTLGIGGLI